MVPYPLKPGYTLTLKTYNSATSPLLEPMEMSDLTGPRVGHGAATFDQPWDQIPIVNSGYVHPGTNIESVENLASVKDIKWSVDNVRSNPGERKAGKTEWATLVILVIISLMASLDATILVPVLPTIASELHGTAADTFWVGTVYLLTNAVVQPFLATLSDIFGRRDLLFFSLALFTVGTIVCCVAKDFTQLLAGRSVQGIGGGGIVVLVLIIMTDLVPIRQRPRYNILVSLAWAFGTITGPLIGGLIAQHTTWRWVFYLNFPFCAVGLFLIPWVVKLETERTSLKYKLVRVDWIGGIIFAGSLTSFLVAISWGGVQCPWKSAQIITPLVIGIIGILAALAWEVRGTDTPFLRLFLFNSRSAVMAYTCSLLQGFLLFEVIYYVPFYLESVKSFTPTITGVAFLPVSCTLLPASILVSLLMTKTGAFRWAMWTGWVVIVLSCGLLIILDATTPTVGWIFIFIVVGIGHGCTLMSLIFGTQAMAKTEDVAYAATMYAFMRSLGYSIGVAIGGSAFQNALSQHLSAAGLPISIAANAEGYVKVLSSLPHDSILRQQVIEAYTGAFKVVWEVMTAFAALGLVCSLGIKHFSLDRKHASTHKLREANEIPV